MLATYIRKLFIFFFSKVQFVNWGYQNNDKSVSLIPKRDPGIAYFSIPDTGIENPIPGLQSLVTVR